MRASFEFVICDHPPESLPCGELGKILSSMEKLVDAMGATDGEGPALSLSDLKDGSTRLVFSVREQAAPQVSSAMRAIRSGDFDTIPSGGRESLSEIAKLSKQTGHHYEIRPHNGFLREMGTVSLDAPSLPPKAAVSGTTTVYAQCVQTGGVSPSVRLRLDSGRLISCSVSEDLARKTALRLYDRVGMSGQAKWDQDTWEMIEFSPEELLDYRETDPVSAFKALAEAAAGRWDDVDAEQYVRDLRSEDVQ